MTSFLKSVLKTLPVSASNQPYFSPLNVTVHPSTEFEEMSNLSTTTVVTALEAFQKSFMGALHEFQNSIAMEMRSISNNLQGLLENCLRESTRDREMLRSILQSMKEIATGNQQSSLLITGNRNNPSIGDDILDCSGSLDNTAEKSFFIEFGIQQPDGSSSKCRIIPPKDLMSMFGKGKRQSEVKAIPSDTLKLLLACAFHTLVGGDRVFLPMILEWKNNSSMSSSDLKKSWYEGCVKWFPNRDTYKGKYGAAGIVHNGVTPVFVVFSYDEEKGLIQPSLTAFVSEKKGITEKFPWEALGNLFMEVLCVRESVRESLGDMKAIGVDHRIVAFYDKEPAELYSISAWFPLHEEDFLIDLPRETWKCNDFSLAVHGVVVFCSKLVTGMYSVKSCNVFVDLAEKLKMAVLTSDVTIFRRAICDVLYSASLKLVNLKKAKLLTDELGNDLGDSDAKGVMETLQVQLGEYFAIPNGKMHFGFEIIYCHLSDIPVFFCLELSSGGSNKKKGGTAGGSVSSKKKMKNTDGPVSKKPKMHYDVSRVSGVSKAARKSEL